MPDIAEPIGWTAAQRRVLVVALLAVVGYVAIRLFRDSATISDPPPVQGVRAAELRDRIDPNTADIATLAALPGLGEKRAADIIETRKQLQRQDTTRPPFTRPEDLYKIKGIGTAMLAQLEPYLIFPTTQPAATKPAN